MISLFKFIFHQTSQHNSSFVASSHSLVLLSFHHLPVHYSNSLAVL